MATSEQQHNGNHNLLTTRELVCYLRIPEISKAEDPNNAIDNLVRMRGLPRLYLCRQRMFWKPAIDRWIEEQLERK